METADSITLVQPENASVVRALPGNLVVRGPDLDREKEVEF